MSNKKINKLGRMYFKCFDGSISIEEVHKTKKFKSAKNKFFKACNIYE